MGKAGFGKATIAAHIQSDKRDYVGTRAKAIGWTKSMYYVAIIDYWLAQGAPSLHARDKVTSPPVFKTLSDLDQRRHRYEQRNNRYPKNIDELIGENPSI